MREAIQEPLAPRAEREALDCFGRKCGLAMTGSIYFIQRGSVLSPLRGS